MFSPHPLGKWQRQQLNFKEKPVKALIQTQNDPFLSNKFEFYLVTRSLFKSVSEEPDLLLLVSFV